VFFIDNWVEVVIYFAIFKEDPYIKDSVGIEVYVVCVWFVTVLIINFYMLIAYLWYNLAWDRHIIISESVGQKPNNKILWLLLVSNGLQLILIIIKYIAELA
jgi:hypothetical protein